LRHFGGIIAEAALEIGVDRQSRRADYVAQVREDRLARDPVVGSAVRPRELVVAIALKPTDAR
jgi:hypothetical protein